MKIVFITNDSELYSIEQFRATYTMVGINGVLFQGICFAFQNRTFDEIANYLYKNEQKSLYSFSFWSLNWNLLNTFVRKSCDLLQKSWKIRIIGIKIVFKFDLCGLFIDIYNVFRWGFVVGNPFRGRNRRHSFISSYGLNAVYGEYMVEICGCFLVHNDSFLFWCYFENCIVNCSVHCVLSFNCAHQRSTRYCD